MAWAISSLPVPVSPSTSTVESVGATRSTSASTDSSAGLSPMISSNLFSTQPCPLDATLLAFSITDSTEAPVHHEREHLAREILLRVHLCDSVITFVVVPLLPGRKVERMIWSNCSSLKGLPRNATAPACIARRRDSL